MTATRRRPTSGELNLAEVLTRLSELGAPSELRRHGPELASGMLSLDRVVLSSVRSGTLVADAVYLSGNKSERVLASLRENRVSLEYPLVEGEIMRRRRAQLVRRSSETPAARYAFAKEIEWGDYVVAPVMVDERVLGFFHGDRQPRDEPLQDADAEALAAFATCFGIVYERAVLRHRLRTQREEMRQVSSWADARAIELGDRPIALDEGDAPLQDAPQARSSGTPDDNLRDLLTRRERDVIDLMVRGETNAAIARDLVLSEGTVKFHVKNILRKLRAANRAEATSRYMRMTLNRGARR